ncbi:MAG: non-heme iron oxygenase ferredoxin subunit [Acidobacteriota bacterium]|jgi:3-phenylpropionate/trans-cinnamate dioxygenase ferredoxin component
MSEWVKVANVEDIPPEGLEVAVDEEPVLLVRKDGDVFALYGLCTHQDMELAGGHLEGSEWVCPHHGARFDVKSGEALSMPAVEDLEVYPVKVEDAAVYVKEPE